MEPQQSRERQPPSLMSDLIFLGVKILLLAVFFGILQGFFFGISRCQDASMEPALQAGDLLLYYRLQKNYEASDVILLEKEGTKQIRRIVAMEGDEVDITEEGLMVNGYVQQETGIFEDTLPFVEGISFPVTLQEGEYFVLGDSRVQAMDSRIYGPVTEKDIKGLVMTLVRRRGI